jgi:hypothetical protein
VKEQTVKRTLTIMCAAVVALTMTMPAVAVAQEKPTLVPLKLMLVVSRTIGEKKISTLPYTLWVTANRPGETNLRMGVEVPVPTSVFTKEGAPTASYHYRNVGTNIDCSVVSSAEGSFNVSITLNDSSIQFESKDASRPGSLGVPSFRNFVAKFGILIKDGQTAQYTSATDPVSGETLRVDITLNVLK